MATGPGVRFEPLGEAAVCFECGEEAGAVARRLRDGAPGWIVDVVPAFGRIMVAFDPLRTSVHEVTAHCATALAEPFEGSFSAKTHVVPVCYELGEDLDDVCARLGIGHDAFCSLHAQKVYDCHAVGFCPGFPYLGWLDDRIAGLPRRPSPRLSVPVGSVAVTVGLTGVYTQPRPGGWWLIGRTPLRLCDPESGHYPVSVGDRVRFEPIGRDEFERREGERL